MEPKARHVLIGLFTVIVSLGIVLAVFLLGQFVTTKNWQYYVIQFNESVSGLSNGTAVEYTGLKVGEVEYLELQDNPNLVHAYVRIQSDVDIRSDVKAVLTMVGITGQSVISLSGGTLEGERLIGKRDERPILYATPSALSQLFSSGEGLVSSLSDTVLRFKRVLSDENLDNFSKTLAHFESISGDVAAEGDVLRSAIRETESMLKNANNAIDKFKSFSQDVQGLVNEQGERALNSMADALNSIKLAANDIQKVVANSRGKLATGLDGLEQVGPAINEFKRGMNAFNRLLREFSESPSHFILDGQQLQEYNP